MIEDGLDITDHVVDVPRIVVGHQRRLAEAADIGTVDAALASEKRDPLPPEDAVARETVFQDYRSRLLPRVEVVIFVDVQLDGRRDFHERHVITPKV